MIMQLISLAIGNIKAMPGYIAYQVYDHARYYYQHDYLDFYDWGIHLFTGKFGKAKTSSMVHAVYDLCSKYPQLFVLTNMSLYNFPQHTKIMPLHSIADILDAPPYCLVVIDEVATIFNNRDFMKYKGVSLSKDLFQDMSQCRHRHMMFFGTATKLKLVDRQFLDITASVTDCEIVGQHPFSRKITTRQYDIDSYEFLQSNPLYNISPINIEVFLQTNKLRSLYDTEEMVEGFLHEDNGDGATVTDKTINITYDKSIDKKIKKRFKHN